MGFDGRLTHPVHFVAPKGGTWPELVADPDARLDDATLADRARRSSDTWVMQTYYRFRQGGASVTLSESPRPHVINVAAPREFGRRNRSAEHFIVIPRADAHRPMLADFVVEQNTGIPDGKARSSVPHWPQPGIVPRASDRTGICMASFKGRVLNMAPALRDQAFVRALAEVGVTYDAGVDEDANADWRDYKAVDVVIAVRNLTWRDALHKPASKLVNAWFAGVPAILGPEPAFRAIGRPGTDYFEVSAPTEALRIIQRLQEEPDLYRSIVEAGRVRAQAFTPERILQRWIEMFQTRIEPAFERWQRLGPAALHARWAAMMLAEPVSKRIHFYNIHHGRRLLP